MSRIKSVEQYDREQSEMTGPDTSWMKVRHKTTMFLIDVSLPSAKWIVQIDPVKYGSPNGNQIKTWLKKNTKRNYACLETKQYPNMVFLNEDDALLFFLTWG